MGWNEMKWGLIGWNGMGWNRMEWNGMEWDRMGWNGMEQNGIDLSCTYLNKNTGLLYNNKKYTVLLK